MQRGEPIIIEKVRNGYIVSPEDKTLMKLDSIMVFLTCEDLKVFLSDHFRHTGRGE
jgi:hypothetical protein